MKNNLLSFEKESKQRKLSFKFPLARGEIYDFAQ